MNLTISTLQFFFCLGFMNTRWQEKSSYVCVSVGGGGISFTQCLRELDSTLFPVATDKNHAYF